MKVEGLKFIFYYFNSPDNSKLALNLGMSTQSSYKFELKPSVDAKISFCKKNLFSKF